MKTRLTQVEFTQFVMRLNEKKEQIQAKFDRGSVNLSSFALEHKVPPTTMSKALEAIGIKRETKTGGAQVTIYSKNIITVLARVCKELNVDYSEIKPYLD